MDKLGRWKFRFAVIADAHVAEVERSTASPFPVGQLTSARYRHAINLLNEHDVDFIINLGDMVNPLPSLPVYSAAAERFHEISRPLRHKQYFIPGNHDVGDKPSGWMPADPVTPSALDLYREHFGPDRQLFEHKGCVFVLLNAELLNADLTEAEEQRNWLEAALADNHGKRMMLAIHYPPFLCKPDEFDHYDNIAEPARTWLLDLLREHEVEAVFSGHVHNFWLNRWANTDLYVVPSLAFPRQDYSEMYASEPEPEGGRNDPAKLGFITVDVYETCHTWRMHRTFGLEQGPDEPHEPNFLPPTILPGETRLSNIGLDMRQDWISFHQVPPSGALDEFYRKDARNDYPLLAINDLGVRDLRIPLNDLLDKRIRDRLFDLRNQDLRLSTYCFGLPNKAIREALRDSRDLLDRIEVVWPERDKSDLRSGLKSLGEEFDLPILISPLWSGHGKTDAQGRHLHVINHGFADADHVTSGSFFDDDVPLGGIEGVVFRLDVDRNFQKAAAAIAQLTKEHGIEAHVIASLTGANPAEWQNDDRVAATGAVIAQLAAVAAPGVRIFLDTFGDVDRGYYRRAGLIDKQCNPKIGWHVMRALRYELHSALDARVANAPLELGEWSLVPINRDANVEYVACHFGSDASPPHGLDIEAVAKTYEVFDLGIGRAATITVNAGELPKTLSDISSASNGSVAGPYYIRPTAG